MEVEIEIAPFPIKVGDDRGPCEKFAELLHCWKCVPVWNDGLVAVPELTANSDLIIGFSGDEHVGYAGR